jgi:hypothetical protein
MKTSSSVDMESVKDFLFKDNKDNMGDKLNIPFYENTLVQGEGKAKLFGVYQIQAKCELECRNFRYGTRVDGIATAH